MLKGCERRAFGISQPAGEVLGWVDGISRLRPCGPRCGKGTKCLDLCLATLLLLEAILEIYLH